MKIFICAGHTTSGKGTGAVGILNESTENRVVSKKVVEYLKQAGHTVVYGEVNKSDNYLAEQVGLANKDNFDLVVQIHFNASNGAGKGTETYYSSSKGKPFAQKITDRLGLLYKQRGAKENTNLYWLRNTKAPAVLVETCFVDNSTDANIYKNNVDKTALFIAEGIHGNEIKTNQTFYRVLVGSYTVRQNADNLVAELKAKGYNPSIVIYNQ